MKRIAAIIHDPTESKILIGLGFKKTEDCIQKIKNSNKSINVDVFNFKGSEAEVLKRINNEFKDYDLIHILRSGDVVLPDFYSSSSVTLEYLRKDYCFSHYYSFDNCELVSDPLFPCQLVVKRWVIEELSACSDFNQLYGKIREQYQGCEVSAILVLS